MENEKNPATAAQGQNPNGGKRGRNHHRRGKGRSHGGSNPHAQTKPSAPATEGTAQQKSGNQNQNQHQNRSQSRPDDRKSHYSTGRPQRVSGHTDSAAELPNMDDLLIEDGMIPANAAVRAAGRVDTSVSPEEIERILAYDVFATGKEVIPDVIPEGKVVIVGIRFRSGGKTYFFDPGKISCQVGKYAIVETARGLEFGEVCIGNRLMDEAMVVPPLRPVIRMATPEDIAHNRENREREQDAFRIGVQKINEHKLDMKLVEVQYTFDNAKLLFYFTSAKRVDFRELVKDLAGVFHLRIELRQIGIRDEARMIGGLGPCGRPLCCTTFLTDFGQVSMKMAKEQNLSLNSTKISGCCGRLMCCLRYEHEAYVAEMRSMPSPGTFVNTPDGPGVVTEVLILKGEVKVSLRNQPDTAPKKYKREQVEPQSRDRRTDAPAPAESVSEPDTEA